MKKLIILSIITLFSFNIYGETKPKISYNLTLMQHLIDTTIVYPNSTYIYSIKKSGSFNGSTYTAFKVTVENGSFDDGTKVKQDFMFEDNIYVTWDDVLSKKAKISIEVQVYDTASYSLVKGRTSILKPIASLKGETPVFTAGPSPAMGTQNTVTATVHQDMYFPEIRDTIFNTIIFQKKVTAYEWTIPNGWEASGHPGQVFTTTNSEKTIYVMPNLVDTGTIKVRGINSLGSAGSEYAKQTFARGFAFTAYPSSITFGDNTSKTFVVTAFTGVTYEWNAPKGWSINGQGNTLEGAGLNSVSVAPSFCAYDLGQVKVRLKMSGETSAWYTCPYDGVVKPGLSTNATSIYQLEDIPFYFSNINMSEVQSIIWSGNGVVYNGISDGNHRIVFTQTGNIALKASVLMAGCTSPIVFAKTVTVLPHRYSISGSNTICQQETYLLGNGQNLPAGAAVTWSSVPAGAVTFSGNGSSITVTKNCIGCIVNISANVIINGSNFTVFKNRVVVGQPSLIVEESSLNLINNNDPYVYQIVSSGGNYKYEGKLQVKDYYGLTTDYQWTRVSGSTVIPIYWSASGNTVILESKASSRYLILTCQASNSCGTTKQNFSFYTGDIGPFSVTLSPNPAIETVNISTITNEEDMSSDITDLELRTEIEIQLWNSFGLVKTVQTNQKSYQLDLSGVSAGFYYVHVIKNGKTYRKQLIVSK